LPSLSDDRPIGKRLSQTNRPDYFGPLRRIPGALSAQPRRRTFPAPEGSPPSYAARRKTVDGREDERCHRFRRRQDRSRPYPMKQRLRKPPSVRPGTCRDGDRVVGGGGLPRRRVDGPPGRATSSRGRCNHRRHRGNIGRISGRWRVGRLGSCRRVRWLRWLGWRGRARLESPPRPADPKRKVRKCARAAPAGPQSSIEQPAVVIPVAQHRRGNVTGKSIEVTHTRPNSQRPLYAAHARVWLVPGVVVVISG